MWSLSVWIDPKESQQISNRISKQKTTFLFLWSKFQKERVEFDGISWKREMGIEVGWMKCATQMLVFTEKKCLFFEPKCERFVWHIFCSIPLNWPWSSPPLRKKDKSRRHVSQNQVCGCHCIFGTVVVLPAPFLCGFGIVCRTFCTVGNIWIVGDAATSCSK